MSTRTDEPDAELRAALLTTLAAAAGTVPTAAPPWPVTRARLVRIGRRRRLRAATATLGCAALVAAAAGVVAGMSHEPALHPVAPAGAASAHEPQVGFPISGQDAWLLGLRKAVADDPPWWTRTAFPGDTATYLPVRPDQVAVRAAEEVGGLRVVQVEISQDYRKAGSGQTLTGGDSARYGAVTGAAPGAVVQLSDNPDGAAWPDPAHPGWVDVLSTRMVDDVQLKVRDTANRVQTVRLGNSLTARVFAPGAQFVSLLDAKGAHELLLTLPVRPLDLAGMRATVPPGVPLAPVR